MIARAVRPHSLEEFRRVYEEQFDFVWRSLRRLGVAAQDAPDAAQEVFSVVYRRLADFEGRSALRTWLFGICMRVGAARRRAAVARYEVVGQPSGVLTLPDGAADPSASVEVREGREILEQLLRQMPVEQQVVFTLFELEGQSAEAIAALVDAPVGTVRSRLRLARAAFRAGVEKLHEQTACLMKELGT